MLPSPLELANTANSDIENLSDYNQYDINNESNDNYKDNDVLTVPHGHGGPGEVLSIEEVKGRLSFHLVNRSYLKVLVGGHPLPSLS